MASIYNSDITPNKNFTMLMLSAIGIVYGDIGTSPLYALKSCFLISQVALSQNNLLGIISLFIWTLFFIVTLKYLYIVMRADNNGEGGILSLSFLCSNLKLTNFPLTPLILGIAGSALFFSDGIITPAISVLSALEGIELIYPQLSSYIVYIAIIILTLLFLIQSEGSSLIGKYFGPIMILWFLTLASSGIYHIFKQPFILKAFNPYYAISFILTHGLKGFSALGGVVLVVTGAEALYADIGHFGKKSIRLSWLYLVFPALILNYLGQGALLIDMPSAINNPFYNLVSSSLLTPLIILSTLATIIASQSIITGIFSITWQAIMLNYLPRMKVIYTSTTQIGQVYVPVINYIMYILTITTVLYFKHSSNMIEMYGIAVTAIMFITTLLLIMLAKNSWQWSRLKICCILVPVLLLDSCFLLVNILKLIEGAFYTIVFSSIIIYLMWIWIAGSKFMIRYCKLNTDQDIENYIDNYPFATKIPGEALFLSQNYDDVPDALIIHTQHNKYLHEKLIILTITIDEKPVVANNNKIIIKTSNSSFCRVIINYGFREIPDFNKIIQWLNEAQIVNIPEKLTIFLSRNIAVFTNEGNNFNKLNTAIYSILYNHSMAAYDFYKMPLNKVLELGVRQKFKIITNINFLSR